MRVWLGRTLPALVLTLVLAAAGPVGAARADDGRWDRSTLAALILPPYQLGDPVAGLDGVWTLLTSGGGFAGYVLRSWPLAPIPGFSGDPLDLLITLDRDGRFLDVTVLRQREPIFVAGLGPEPFDAFLRQYRGHALSEPISVGAADGSSRGTGSGLVHLDGVTKATASVRIANEAILAAARKVAREKMQGLAPRAVALPLPDHDETLDWAALEREGIARRLRVRNADVQALFAGSVWEDDDPEAADDPDGLYLDLWVIDVGPPSVARAVLAPDTQVALARTMRPGEEPILLLASGRHPLLGPDFVRNTEPDGIAAVQDGLPVPLRHADVDVRLAGGVPAVEQTLLVRADTRLGFDPSSPWTLIVRADRAHGSFRPERAARDLAVDYHAPARFFAAPEARGEAAPMLFAAVQHRAIDLAAMLVLLAGLVWLMARRMPALAGHRHYPTVRLAVLAVVVVFVGWGAEAQLSIVTPLAVLQNALGGGSLAFLLFEPVVLLVWAVTLLSLVVWGRGLFCGWLCPYGALQELAHALGRRLWLPTLRVLPQHDRRLKLVKYGVLAAVVAGGLGGVAWADGLIEVEPFKTAMTMRFDRPLPYVLYAAFWILLGVFVFKAFCRWVCPLGAALALGGRLRRWDWIARRAECGTPCQYCRVRCDYGAIDAAGRIDYAECFQCLECVRIIEDPGRCVPERIARKTGRRLAVLPTRGRR